MNLNEEMEEQHEHTHPCIGNTPVMHMQCSNKDCDDWVPLFFRADE